MFRLLALLQLTRAALAFTAIADAWAVMLLQYPLLERQFSLGWLSLRMLLMAVISAGLYGFGMALNDLMDARRDRVFAPRRPIPSGRIDLRTAIITCLVLLMAALIAAVMLDTFLFNPRWDYEGPPLPWSFLLAVAAAALIVLYDATTKYLGGLGLLTLGGVRAVHCLIGNPTTHLLFLSIFLYTHIVLVSTLAYRLESKRPRLRQVDYWVVLGGLVLGNGLAMLYMFYRLHQEHASLKPLPQMLIGPVVATVCYWAWALVVLRKHGLSPRQKGGRLMVVGLFWLFVYDASALFSNGQWKAGLTVCVLSILGGASFVGLRLAGRFSGEPRPHYRHTNSRPPAVPAR